jgi:hypothetical protein
MFNHIQILNPKMSKFQKRKKKHEKTNKRKRPGPLLTSLSCSKMAQRQLPLIAIHVRSEGKFEDNVLVDSAWNETLEAVVTCAQSMEVVVVVVVVVVVTACAQTDFFFGTLFCYRCYFCLLSSWLRMFLKPILRNCYQ